MPSLDGVPMDVGKVFALERYTLALITCSRAAERTGNSADLKLQICVAAHAGDIRAGSDAGMHHCRQLIDEGSSLVCFRDAAAVEENLRVGGEGFFPCGDLRRMGVKGVGIECLFAKPERAIAAVRNHADHIEIRQTIECYRDLLDHIAITVNENNF